jgi:RNA polymerase sigma factor (sigma-70 family)
MENSDTQLVARVLAGEREAFSQIVAKYQNLICSLAYSAIGNLGQSEDVAQETFITAWRHLGHLREPSKLRAWLCGIVRNRIQKCLRREGRDLVHVAEPLESATEAASAEALPSERTISQEEEAILWRSLARIPELYRQPLVLFYREHRSIGQVAVDLELSEDAVKQRLTRGRRLLQQEIRAFVEGALEKTAPGQRFSSVVLAALPMGAGSAATGSAGLAGKSVAAGKWSLLGTWMMPLVGIVSGLAAHWYIFRAAPTARERRLKKIGFIVLWSFVLGWCVGGQLAMNALSRSLQWDDATYFTAMTGFWSIYAIAVATWGVLMFRRMLAIRKEAELDESTVSRRWLWNPVMSVLVITGIHLACFWWLIELAVRAQDGISAVTIFAIMIVLIFWHLLRLRGKTGVASFRTVILQIAVIWGLILVALNLRLEAWEAALHGISVEAMQVFLPRWVLAALSLALVLWVGVLVVLTRTRAPRLVLPEQAPE